MVKTIALAAISSLVSATKEAYAPPAAAAVPYAAPAAEYGAYPQHNGYYRKSFPPEPYVLDPNYFHDVLNGFKQCVEHKCKTLPTTYTTTPAESLETVGAYTSCITSCAASEMMRVTVDFKDLIAKLIDVGNYQLAEGHRYLAGKSNYDVLGNNTHIGESCCLPDNYFVSWKELVFTTPVTLPGAETVDRFISVESYLQYCTKPDSPLFMGKFEVQCNVEWIKYLSSIHQSIGNLILSPMSNKKAPAGSCSDNFDPNPRADEFNEDMCVAYEYVKGGQIEALDQPILKYPSKQYHYKDSCEDDEDEAGYLIKYQRVPRHSVPFFTLADGLPSSYGKCEYGFGLVSVKATEGVSRFVPAPVPSPEELEAVDLCPLSGQFEYCNMKQYVHWLQWNLFDLSECPLVDLKDNDVDETDAPYAYFSLACLYRILSMKCDCMEAVLNCYEHEYSFSSSIGKTLGKAASVLCGFILCQKPEVYSLLGGERAINRANIMKEVLMQVGAMTNETSGFPPVTFAFLSFGLGMLCFMVTKKILNKSKSPVVGMEEGYRNLI